jgi:spermidine synthase
VPSRRAILLLFTLSGGAGLVYQVIWARQLGLVFGNTTTSISIVLGAFMAGLGLGAAVAGRVVARLRDPMRWYALFEGGIGAYALAFAPLVRGAESLYPAFFSETTGIATLTAVRVAAAFALLLVPTTLMGATLPLVTEYLHRLAIARSDWNAGRLYGANTFGAALGSFAAGFVLIEWIGIAATTRIAAGLNFAVMAIALWLAARAGAHARAARSAAAGPAPRAGRAGLAILAVFAGSGALALAGEVVWTRALTLLLGSSTYAFSAILIVYLVGIALGSWALSGRVRALADPAGLLPVLVLGIAIWHVAAVGVVPWLYRLHDLLFAESLLRALGALLAIGSFGAAVLTLILPPALLSGALFPLITRLVGGVEGDRGEPVARAYLWNTLGSIGGSLLAGFVLAPLWLHFHAIQVLALFAAGLALGALGAVGWRERPARAALVGGLALATGAASALGLSRPDLFVALVAERRPEFRVLHHESGLQGITSVLVNPELPNRSASLLVDGTGMTAKLFATKAMAHLPLIAHGDAEQTLVVCLGMGTTFRSALAHGGHVEVVELVPGVMDAMRFFYADADAVAANDRGRVIVNDGRNHLLLTRRRYDVITVDPPPPIERAGVNHLYSSEFLALVREHLAEGGVAAHWVPRSVPRGGVREDDTLRMLIATFLDAFPHVRLLRSADGIGVHMLGSEQPITLDAGRVAAALGDEAVARDLREFPWAQPSPADLVAEIPVLRADYEGAPRLSDDRPLLEFHLLRDLAAGRGSPLSVSP